MSVAVGSMLDVSAMGDQAQDVFSPGPEAFKPDSHLAFRSDRVRRCHTRRPFRHVAATIH